MKRVSIFAHYDENNLIQDYVVNYVSELRKISDVIFISDSDVPKSEVCKINNYCIYHKVGRHNEYDFGSYKLGYNYILDNNLMDYYNYFTFCNDSMILVGDLGEVINKSEIDNPPVYGMYRFPGYRTDRKLGNIPPHLQSWYITVNREVFIKLARFINSVDKYIDKMNVVVNYEYGLSKLLSYWGYELKSIFGPIDNKHLNLPHNKPKLMLDLGFPFVKKYNIDKVRKWLKD